MQVIIAEKPSVAREIAAIVGATNRKDGFIEGNGYAVTWAFGHLVGLAMPQQYGIAGFRRENLPILPSSFILLPRQVREGKEYKADPGVVKQLGILRELFGMAERIIVATDAGREGELIFRYIYSYLECRTPFVRLWISSLTDRAIREGLQHLRPGNEYDNLYLSAKARSEADWIVGINASQALAVAAGRGVWSLGRVQTPTLAIICSRYLENKAFKPATYFRLKLSTAKEGTEFTVLSTEKFDGREKAEAARAEVIGARTVRVVNVERKETREQPPLLYDLTTLQKEANSRYGFSAEKTLDIAQSLYEKKFITYPRTGSRYISEDVAEEIPALIGNMTRYPRFAEYASRMDTASLSRRSVDNEKIADHHALLPTENLPSELDADHRIVYEMVAGRMLETFSGACVKENTSLTLQSAGHDFTARGSIMVETGWRAVLNEPVEEKEEDMTLLPDIVQGDELPVKGCGTEQKQTRPRPPSHGIEPAGGDGNRRTRTVRRGRTRGDEGCRHRHARHPCRHHRNALCPRVCQAREKVACTHGQGTGRVCRGQGQEDRRCRHDGRLGTGPLEDRYRGDGRPDVPSRYRSLRLANRQRTAGSKNRRRGE